MSELLGRIRRAWQLPLGGPIRQLLVYDDQFLLVKSGKLDGASAANGASDIVSAVATLALLPFEAVLIRRSATRSEKWASMSPADWLATGKVVWNIRFADIKSARHGRKWNHGRLIVEDNHGKTRGVAWESAPNEHAEKLLKFALGATLQPLR